MSHDFSPVIVTQSLEGVLKGASKPTRTPKKAIDRPVDVAHECALASTDRNRLPRGARAPPSQKTPVFHLKTLGYCPVITSA
jgi:hypothetical protein